MTSVIPSHFFGLRWQFAFAGRRKPVIFRPALFSDSRHPLEIPAPMLRRFTLLDTLGVYNWTLLDCQGNSRVAALSRQTHFSAKLVRA